MEKVIHKRNLEIDIIKGLCIASIVCLHADNNILWFNMIFIYGFYFSAGYTFKDKPLIPFVKSKVRRIYIPFVINCMIISIILKLISYICEGYPEVDFGFALKNSLLFNAPYGILAPVWFLFPFSIILFIYYFLQKKIKNTYIILGLSFLLYSLTYIFLTQINNRIWNFSAWIPNVGIGFFVFSCGQFLKNHKSIEEKLFEGKYSIDLFIISSCILFSIMQYTKFQIDLRVGNINSFLYNTLAIMFGICFLFYLSKLLVKSTVMRRIFSSIGCHSFAIMFYHFISYSIVTISVHYILDYPIPTGWSMNYTDGIWPIINSIIGIFIPLFGAIVYSNTKKHITNYIHCK